MPHLHRETHGDILVLRLDRPKANALDLAFAEELAAGFTDAAKDDPRAMILTGTGNSFSAGLDLKALPGYSLEEQDRMVRALNQLCLGLYSFPRPVVGAINGHAIAGGMIVALGCDYRIAAEGPARFGLTEGLVGVAFPVGACEIARSELSPSVARRWMLGAGTVDGAQALAEGALDELVPHADLQERSMAHATALGHRPGAYAAIKTQLRREALDRMRLAVDSGDPLEGNWLGPHVAAAIRSVLAG